MGFLSRLFGRSAPPSGMIAVDPEKDVRQIQGLAYVGETNERGEIPLGSGGWAACQAVIVPAESVPSWSEFAFKDYVYAFRSVAADKLLFMVHFRTVLRKDNAFLFLFDLNKTDVQQWLYFLYNARTIAIVSGPDGSPATALVIEVKDPSEVGNLQKAMAYFHK